jgi:hypothetical protein
VAKRLVMHIGMPKCGSTSIQAMLAAEIDVLNEANIIVPKSLNFENSWRLSAAILQQNELKYFTNVMKVFSLNECDNIKIELTQTLKQLKTAVAQHLDYTIVISSEYLYSKCLTPKSVFKLKELLGGWFDVIEIVFVTKHPISLIKSMYAQYVQGPAMGSITFEDYVQQNLNHSMYDYLQQLKIWQKEFSDANMIVIDINKLDSTSTLIELFMQILTRSKENDIGVLNHSTNKSLDYNNLKLLAKFNHFKYNNKLLSRFEFNHFVIKVIRNIVRYLPLRGNFPKINNIEQLENSYRNFLEKYQR